MAKEWKQDHSYDDILFLPHPVSQTHLPMSRSDRAAQFSPYKSLVGLDSAMEETGRQTMLKIELDEHEKAILDEKLRSLQARLLQQPEVFITYFRPDAYKEGGNYCETAGVLKSIDPVEQRIVLKDGQTIPLDDICAIETE